MGLSGQWITGSLTLADNNYSITCGAGIGQTSTSQPITASDSVVVHTLNGASVDLKANGADSLTVQNNQPVTLTWSTSNVVSGSCVASGEWSGTKSENNASGESVGNLSTGNHDFTLTCREQGTSNSKADTVSVTSIDPPCVPNGCTASDTCKGDTCNNGCGTVISGTKECNKYWKEVAP